MKIGTRALVLFSACGITAAAWLQAQGPGGGEWTTSGSDAQRTAWVRADATLSREAVRKGELKFLWKATFENHVIQLNSLTQPILLDRLIGFRGFKALAFIGGSADRVFAIDTDLGRPYWTTHLNYSVATGGQPPSSWTCPGGLIATPTRRTSVAPPAFGRGGGGGRGGRSASAVGLPGRGAAILSEVPQGRGMAPPPSVPPPAAAPTTPAVAPIPFGGVDPVYAVGSDGLLHTLASSNGADMVAPVPFLPPSSKPSGLIFIDGVVYTSTSDGCGAAPNAVWALDLASKEKKAAAWTTSGANIAGTVGPTLGTDGILYVAVGTKPGSNISAATTPGGQGTSDAIVALEPKILARKDWFTADGADFNASPIVFRYKDQELVAATANDGRLYLLDSASLGGADHKTPLYVTPAYTGAGAGAALATWEDQGTRWILAPAVAAASAAAAGQAANGTLVAFKLVDQNGKLTLESGWTSRGLTSPLGPIVVNGVVFVASSGEFRGSNTTLGAAQRAQRSTPAVLYALDGSTGKDLWNSGKTITSFARGGLSAGSGQVYVVTFDNTLYAFGIPMER
jgi:hypothetical protein